MDKIKCPHCGAINQDVTEQEACWNCGKSLAAAPAPLMDAPDASPEAGGQQMKTMKTKPTLEERVAARKAARRANPAVPVILVILALLIILLIIFFARPH